MFVGFTFFVTLGEKKPRSTMMIQGTLKRPSRPLEVPPIKPLPPFKPWLPLSHQQSVLLLSTELAVLVGRHKLTL